MKNKTFRQLKNLWKEDFAYSRTITTAVCRMGIRVETLFIPLWQQASNFSLAALLIAAMIYVFFPNLANADMEFENIGFDEQTVVLIIDAMQNKTEDYGRLPMAPDVQARRHYTIPITAYTSDVSQTDDTPCITASGINVCERDVQNIVAANFLPLGTRVKIPELYGDRIFYVEDRMNARYNYKMDIWMKDLSDAKAFGVQFLTIEVF